MGDSRAAILARIRDALRDVPDDERPEDVEVARAYRRTSGALDAECLAETFVNRLHGYGASVERCERGQVAARVAAICEQRGLRRLGTPAGLPMHWHPPGVELVADVDLPVQRLDQLDAALTGCAAAVADTGTLVLDSDARCGRRALTLVPDTHICVVEINQLVVLVPEAITRLAVGRAHRTRPITFISGPSASSDIELARVEGVHGPRNLVVVLTRR